MIQRLPMKVHLPAIIGFVPNDMVIHITTFLEACYIAQCLDINMKALDCLEDVVNILWH